MQSFFGSAILLAQASAPGAAGPDMIKTLGFMVILFALLYFMMLRPQMKKEKERKKLIANIKSGDRVLFAGGILGTVANVKDQLFVVKIAENVKIEIARGAVLRVLEKDEAPGEMDKN